MGAFRARSSSGPIGSEYRRWGSSGPKPPAIQWRRYSSSPTSTPYSPSTRRYACHCRRSVSATTPSRSKMTPRTTALGVWSGNHGERGERAGERERQAQRCAAGGRSEQPSGSAAAAALPRIVRRSRHGYPDSLLGAELEREAPRQTLEDRPMQGVHLLVGQRPVGEIG